MTATHRQQAQGLWSMPFRPMFFGVGVFACLAVPLWYLRVRYGLGPQAIGIGWHIHEMLFGFAGGTVVGFLLTAAQTWTGVRALNGYPLAALAGVWLLARWCWLLGDVWIAALADTLFFSAAAASLGHMTIVTRNWRNLFFTPVLLIFAFTALRYAHLLQQQRPEAAREVLNLVFFLLVHIVLVVGGRVIPFFTDRRLQRPQTQSWQALERLALGCSLAFMATLLAGAESEWQRGAALLVAGFNALRWWRWRPWQTRREPLLWSLHAAYFAVILGFALLAAGFAQSTAIHAIAVGGIGLMILAMASRVSLGHSGLPLQAPPGMAVAFGLLLVALFARVAAGLAPAGYLPLLQLSAMAWGLAFAVFSFRFFPILLLGRLHLRRPGPVSPVRPTAQQIPSIQESDDHE